MSATCPRDSRQVPLVSPVAITVSPQDGSLYIAEADNKVVHRVRRVDTYRINHLWNASYRKKFQANSKWSTICPRSGAEYGRFENAGRGLFECWYGLELWLR